MLHSKKPKSTFIHGQARVTSADSERSLQNAPRSDGTCSIGIGRESWTTTWDVTVYNVPQPLRQDINIIATLKKAEMDKGQSITVSWPAQAITITNIDNAPAFDYDVPEVRAPIADPNTGKTKVQLQFEIKDANVKWTSDDCSAGNVVRSGGRESWSCNFPCTVSQAKEL